MYSRAISEDVTLHNGSLILCTNFNCSLGLGFGDGLGLWLSSGHLLLSGDGLGLLNKSPNTFFSGEEGQPTFNFKMIRNS